MFAHKPLTAILAVMLVLATMVPLAAADTAATDTTTDASVTVTIQTTSDATVLAFEHAGEAYSDASVTVQSVANASYTGSGQYETDTNGELVLPTPEADTAVHLVVESDDVAATTMITLHAYTGSESETTVTIDAQTDSSGSVDRSGNDSRLNASAEQQAEANNDENESFGARLSSFVHSVLSGTVSGIGSIVSDFAVGNNPSDSNNDAPADANANVNGSADIDADNASVGVDADTNAGSGAANTSSNVTVGADTNQSATANAEANATWSLGLFD